MSDLRFTPQPVIYRKKSVFVPFYQFISCFSLKNIFIANLLAVHQLFIHQIIRYSCAVHSKTKNKIVIDTQGSTARLY
jgi:hypothetical protein